MRGAVGLLLVMVLVCGASAAWALLRPRSQPPLPSLRVEVLNGSSTPGLAARAATALRALGQDVVATGNAARSDYRRTVVVDRRGRPWVARRLADRIGPALIVLQQTDRAAADVTVLLGDDAPRLRLLGGGGAPRTGVRRWLPGGCLGGFPGPGRRVAALPPRGGKCYLAGGKRPSSGEVWRCPDDHWVFWP